MDRIRKVLDIATEKQQKEFDSVFIICGAEGCLSGDTLISINRAKLGRKITLKRLYNQYNGNPDRIIEKNRFYDFSIPTFVRSFNGRQVRLHKLKNVFYSGKKMLYKIILSDGKEIKATSTHKFLTKEGWIELSKLNIGQEVMTDNFKTLKKGDNGNTKIKLYDIQLTTKYHPYSSRGRVEVHRLIYESRINNLKFREYLDILLNDKDKSQKLTFINPNIYHIHHKDECHYNNSIENLELMKKEDHAKLHSINNYLELLQWIPIPTKIISITEAGIEDTYDIECEEPYHNFVANGIIVHNSSKSHLGLQCMDYLKGNVDDISLDQADFVESLQRAEDNGVVVFDEAGDGLFSRDFASSMSKQLVKTFMVIRAKKLITFLILPSFFMIDVYFRRHRVRGLFYVYKRGRTAFFDKRKIAKIIAYGEKGQNMWVARPTFYDNYPIYAGHLLEEYKKKKTRKINETLFSMKISNSKPDTKTSQIKGLILKGLKNKDICNLTSSNPQFISSIRRSLKQELMRQSYKTQPKDLEVNYEEAE